MKKVLAAGFVLGVLASAHGAAAADLSVAPLYNAPPAQVTPVYNWTGFYLGANGGGGWGHSHWNTATTEIGLAGGQAAAPSATTGNRQRGVRRRGRYRLVSALTGSRTIDRLPWRLQHQRQLAFHSAADASAMSFDRVMPYATGGLAVGDIRAVAPGFAGGMSTNAGWTLGGGVEVALPGNWTHQSGISARRSWQLQLRPAAAPGRPTTSRCRRTCFAPA